MDINWYKEVSKYGFLCVIFQVFDLDLLLGYIIFIKLVNRKLFSRTVVVMVKYIDIYLFGKYLLKRKLEGILGLMGS